MIEAAVAALEVRQGGPDEPDGVHEVDVEAGLPVLLGVGDGEGADVGHDHVEAAERGGRLLHPRRERLRVADVRTVDPVTSPRSPSASCVAADLVGVAGAEADDGALVEEGLDDRPADATGAAGDQDARTGELQIHGRAFRCGRARDVRSGSAEGAGSRSQLGVDAVEGFAAGSRVLAALTTTL